ncbi:hypothetical protein [Solicola gregarius]|uniref:Uncharacterized protein n=1 Tax=Solicola gregarius TaxID=2908642 RepID=A0AA46TGX4_9ACTN|nr:hypothetical protein [Solicola gregarius]UYM04624.1 hypothetical protein L0C25_19130 [Solicola gregarius]
MTSQLELDVRTTLGAATGSLRIVLADAPTARHATRVAEDLGWLPGFGQGPLTLVIPELDAKSAVDVLAELAWAGVLPVAFSLT